ncbi:membrane protein insertase YidC [Mucilaginibacter terrenus]|uniref:Membrane protein insertase YidC n=1 Tax=Mucilaginibacter terrenus TaxID=2482727 RepID=A0A3E2NX29_9SPHI|nr:membrane protein insertase YidC [Mucilaginibacter terrenus]RFZ85527.1 membrane protein insertase YidC [Mucilaginibacter terrenus]
MDKNTFTGLFLIMVIMVVGVWWMKPSEAELKKNQEIAHQDSIKKGYIKTKTAANAAQSAKADTSATAQGVVDSAVLKAPFGAATVGKDSMITLENNDISIKLSTKGGNVYSAELKNYKTYDKKPLILFSGDNNAFGLTFSAAGKAINTNSLYFKPSTTSLKVAGSDSASLTMRLSYSPTQYIDYVYSLKGTGFKVGFTIKPVGLDQVIANSGTINLSWAASLHKQERDIKMERTYSTVYFKNTENSVDYLSETKDDTKAINDQKLQWIAFKQHFFSSALIAKEGVTISKSNLAVTTDINDTTDVKQMKADIAFNRNSLGAVPLEFYFGPNRYSILKDQGYDLQKIVNLGWGPLKYINQFATLPIFNFLNNFNMNYGIIILILTVILKLVLSPLTYKSYLSMAKMRVIKPEMDEIKAKVGEDNPTLLQQEYLKLYKKAGVNPLGGCLPLVIQMPIVIAFFRFFPSLFELRGQSFLWMHDLSTYDAVISFSPIMGVSHISLMCLLMTISTLIYTYFNNQISGATGQMKYIGYITPLVFLVTLNSYPAGLNYYYFLANMFTFLQQYLIKFMVDDKKIHAQIQENKKKPEDAKKKSGFSAKLEEMMRQQQQVQAKKK